MGSERQPAGLPEDGQQRAAGPTVLPVEQHPIPQRPSHARSAGSGARGLASNLQNNLDGSHNCGRAPKSGTLSAAAGLKLSNFRAPSEKTPAFGRNLTPRPNSAPAAFNWGPRRSPAKRVRWGEEEQGSGRSFRRKAETELSGLCDDEDRARPVFSISSQKKKRKWGVQMHQPSSWLKSPPPARARKKVPPPADGGTGKTGIRAYQSD